MSTPVLEYGEGVIPHSLIPSQRAPEPVCIGPTWRRDDVGRFVLPELTIGWQVIKWVGDNLLSDEVDDLGHPKPFSLTHEQVRFLLHFYAVDERGRFVYRNAVLQRLKGWGLPR